jgi:hypothetical protein
MQVAKRSFTARFRADLLLRNNGIYLAGSVGVGVLGYVFHFASGRLLGPTNYALVAAMISALSLLSLPTLVLQTTAARYASLLLARRELGAIPPFLLRLTLACVVPTAAAVAVLFVAAPAVARYLHITDLRIIYLLVTASAIALLVSISRGAMQGLSRFLALSINTTIDMATRVCTSVLLILGGLGALGAALAIVAGPAVSYIQSLFIFRRYVDAIRSWRWWGQRGSPISSMSTCSSPSII